MGFLWENMEKMDIQLERRNTAEAKQEAAEAKQEAVEAKQEAAEAKQEAAEAKQEAEKQKQKAEDAEKSKRDLCGALIAAYQDQGMGRESAKKQLMRMAGLQEEIIDELFDSLWCQ